ncbi:class I SAM-dependent methyltransferase [Actinomycetospora atypica]|uniref:Class I SAM-dependent methyltransferase n=1 Tax=Actinomycetospora atypica TaxID=1290095 RepID=A0ABV9YRW4_9PSEU
MGGWSRALLVPQVVRLGRRAPRVTSTRWERYWASTGATGDDGDVLWDSSTPGEAQHYLELLAAHADPRLPIVDLGCGNGRFTRALARHYPRVLGVDVAPAAITRARAETDGPGTPDPRRDVRFRAIDATAVGSGRRLREEVGGDAHVFIRGVLHVLDDDARQRLVATVRALVGSSGTVLVAETNHRGSALSYLESLGATPRGMPAPLARAISSGLPTPRPFGIDELNACFPPGRWEAVRTERDAEITVVPLRRHGVPEHVPALVAVLRPRPGRAAGGVPPGEDPH